MKFIAKQVLSLAKSIFALGRNTQSSFLPI